MTAEILAVGTELLMGQIANTNAQYISSRLPDIGINVYFHQVAGDNPVRLKSALESALGRSDIVIMTGGLGPTMDDLTKDVVAGCFGKRLVLDEGSLFRIRERMARSGNLSMPKNNEKQAYLPEGAIILSNDNGTAPGCIIEEGGKTVVMLPGPPSEMRPMFNASVMPFLGKYAEYRLESKFLRVFGIGESRLEEMLKDLVEAQTNPTLATYAKEGEVTLRVTARYPAVPGKKAGGNQTGIDMPGTDSISHIAMPGTDIASSIAMPGTDNISPIDTPDTNIISPNDTSETDIISPIVGIIRERLGDCLFSEDNENLEEAALRALACRNLTLALAESCTGGLIASRVTDIPGASEVFLSSAVTYSNRAKMSVLGVREETLRVYGAVSSQTALEMADGARRVSGSDIAVSVTGIAGPGGGSEEKPVGLVYLALSDENGAKAKEIRVTGPRARVRNIACLNAFDMIRRAALGLPWVD